MASRSRMLALLTCDGAVVKTSREEAERCVTIKNMLDDAGDEAEGDMPKLPVSLVDEVTLQHVLCYCASYTKVNHKQQLTQLLSLEIDMLFKLTAAANFLEMPQLFELACSAVAEHIRRTPSADAIRARFGILADMSTAELRVTTNEVRGTRAGRDGVLIV